jgi:hypothetical protein
MELNDDHKVEIACAALQAIIRADPKLVKDNPSRVAGEAVNVAVLMITAMKESSL